MAAMETKLTLSIDEALATVGGFRRWHFTMFLLIGLSLFMPICWQTLIIVFSGWEPPHSCRTQPVYTPSSSQLAILDQQLSSSSQMVALDQCSMFDNSSNLTINCRYGWEFANEGYYTMTEQWSLVCEGNYLNELSQMLFQLGTLPALLFVSPLVDRFGRKPVFVYSHIFIAILGTGMAFADSYTTFVIIRTILGCFIITNVCSGTTYLLELYDTTRRAKAGVGVEVMWIFCYMTLPVLCYLIKDWRNVQIVISSASFIWIVFIPVLPESPQWLAVVGRRQEAEEILCKMARWNGVKLPAGGIHLISNEEHKRNALDFEGNRKEEGIKMTTQKVDGQSAGHAKSVSSLTEEESKHSNNNLQALASLNANTFSNLSYGSNTETSLNSSNSANASEKRREFANSPKRNGETEMQQNGTAEKGTDDKDAEFTNSPKRNGTAETKQNENGISENGADEKVTSNGKTVIKDTEENEYVADIPIIKLFTDANLRLTVVVCNCLWFANCLLYYGLILATPTLAGNRFVNFTLMGIVELPASLLALYCADKFGRRLSTCVFHILAGIPLALIIFIPETTSNGTSLTPLVISLAVLAKFGISSSFSIIIIYMREVFPTGIRSTGSGMGQISAAIGNMVAPLCSYANKTSLYWLPNILYGIVSVSCGLLTLLLPETAGMPMPQSLADLHFMFKHRRFGYRYYKR